MWFRKLICRAKRMVGAQASWLGYLFSGKLFLAMWHTRGTSAPVTWRVFWWQKICGKNRAACWPVSPDSVVGCPERIKIGIGSAPGLGFGCYIQGRNGIEIGDYVLVAPKVNIISANHDPEDVSRHLDAPPIKVGSYSWLGVGATILPGVQIGPHTVVAAGAVVTKSSPEGYCILAGVPAKVIKHLDKAEVKEYHNKYPYRGYERVKVMD